MGLFSSIFGGSTASTSSRTSTTVTNKNRNTGFSNTSGTTISNDGGGSVQVTDFGAVKAALDTVQSGVASAFDYGGSALQIVADSLTNNLQSTQAAQAKSLDALNTLSRGDASNIAAGQQRSMVWMVGLVVAGVVVAKVAGGK